MSSAAPTICDACRTPIAMPGTFITLSDKHYHQGCGVGAYARRIEHLEKVIAAAFDDLESGNEASAYLILKTAVNNK